jgi:hypothetical protein
MSFTAALVALVASNSPKPKTMKSDQTLILTGEGYGLEIAPEATTLRDELATAAGAITTVTTNEEADAARAEIKRLADFRNLIEKSRKAVKEPVLAIGKDIDAKASEFGSVITTEEARLKKLVGDHALKVEAERRAEAELRAPVAGTVNGDDLRRRIGATVARGEPLFSIAAPAGRHECIVGFALGLGLRFVCRIAGLVVGGCVGYWVGAVAHA